MSKIKELFDTGDVFHGRNDQHIWRNETSAWLTLTNNSSYPFPELECSTYQLPTYDNYTNLGNPVICQDICWSFDGTSFVTSHSDYGVRQYLLPENESNGILIPFKRFFRPQSMISTRVHPKYSLFGENNYNVMLVASKDLPIQLFSLSASDCEHRSLFNYDVVNTENESFETIYAMDFLDDSKFLSGTIRNKVSLHDLNRKDPVWCSNSSRKSCGKSAHRAIVSCFDQAVESCQETSRYMGTYKNELFHLDVRSHKMQLLKKNFFGLEDHPRGIIQILFSVNGHYMYVIKRNSAFIDILDARNSFSTVNRLALPSKITKQKFKASINQSNGLIIGSFDGQLLQWSSDIIEFGGLSPLSSNEVQAILPPSTTCQTRFTDARINIVAFNPEHPHMVAYSYSPDKFSDSEEARSGISITEL